MEILYSEGGETLALYGAPFLEVLEARLNGV